MLINKTNLDFLFQQWDSRFKTIYGDTQTYYQYYSSEIPSNTERTVHSWLAQQGPLREWVGHRVIENVVTRDFAIINKDWEKTVGLQKNKVADDTYGVFANVVDDLGQQARLWPDDLMTTVVEAGTTETAFDGQYFFDTDHPVDLDDSSKGTYSNNLVGASYDLSLDPVGAYKRARQAGMKIVGEGGRSLGITYDLLMVPPDLEEAALRIASATVVTQKVTNIAGSENVAAVAVDNLYKGAITVLVNPRLSNQSVGYLLSTRRPIKPFIFQLRQPPNLVARTAETDPQVFDAKMLLYGVDARGNGSYSFPFLAVRLAPS